MEQLPPAPGGARAVLEIRPLVGMVDLQQQARAEAPAEDLEPQAQPTSATRLVMALPVQLPVAAEAGPHGMKRTQPSSMDLAGQAVRAALSSVIRLILSHPNLPLPVPALHM